MPFWKWHNRRACKWASDTAPSLFVWIWASLQSYHDPDSEEEDGHHVSEIVAGASVSSSYTVSQLEEEKHNDEGEIEKVEEEDLPEQPPPAEEKDRKSVV